MLRCPEDMHCCWLTVYSLLVAIQASGALSSVGETSFLSPSFACSSSLSSKPPLALALDWERGGNRIVGSSSEGSISLWDAGVGSTDLHFLFKWEGHSIGRNGVEVWLAFFSNPSQSGKQVFKTYILRCDFFLSLSPPLSEVNPTPTSDLSVYLTRQLKMNFILTTYIEIIVSGGDDGLMKGWDLRMPVSAGPPAFVVRVR